MIQANELRVGDRVEGPIRAAEVLKIETIERSSHPLSITFGLVYDDGVETSITRTDRFAAKDLVNRI